MRKSRLDLAVMLLAVLTALKLMFPAHSADLREYLEKAFENMTDYRETVAAMGRNLTQNTPGEQLRAVFGADGGGGSYESGT